MMRSTLEPRMTNNRTDIVVNMFNINFVLGIPYSVVSKDLGSGPFLRRYAPVQRTGTFFPK